MANFFKDSIRELKHVVWPTRQETTNYFIIVLIVLTLFGLYLFIASTIFSEVIMWLKNLI
ncbi:MAG: preprotein translocase subunit SecE [Candidatus Peribacteria bacterium]|jgi:preprotein translocase subunit SecE|nr:preprotein translocase subunit SecE [Candidatus Peribacteria bacterium]